MQIIGGARPVPPPIPTALPSDGTIPKHINSVLYVDQDMDPRYKGPSLTDNNYSGRSVHTITDFRPGVAEVLSSEITHGMTQIRVPHLTHTTVNSVCNEVDAEAHKTFNSRQVHYCCCMMAAHFEMEKWIDHLEDETLFGWLFETGENSHELSGSHAGVVTAVDACYDEPRHLGETECPNTPSIDTLQSDHRCESSICRSCLNICQLNSGFGQSTSSFCESGVSLDITQENIWLRQEEDTVLNQLIQWKRDNSKLV